MIEAQLTATKIPVNDLLDLLAAIGNRDYSRFQELEQAFVSQHGEEVWQEVFNFRVLPALDKPASQWLLARCILDAPKALLYRSFQICTLREYNKKIEVCDQDGELGWMTCIPKSLAELLLTQNTKGLEPFVTY